MKKIAAMLTLLSVLGIPLALFNIQTLYSWFPALRPAVANAIDVVTGYVPPKGPSLRVTHECKYLDRKATQCWSHLKIVSMNEQPITIEQIIVNGRPECVPNDGVANFAMLLAAQFINVTNTTIKTGDAYGVGVSCEPVTVKIVTDKGTWTGGAD
ncbi:hypothetical protein [Bradyrhizobium diazoefficiens]|uniref:hypothetical protein n=1 Tax=Bradyrhizobium diazoefficiens TaxID=1355477 RepID=UPI002714FD37|nr:hypothetical protein [Bradyrhizobium diazoefficiens]WLC16302.1 hypothetical protein QIH76_40590 [Bradyrhizobium diazoefficiens]